MKHTTFFSSEKGKRIIYDYYRKLLESWHKPSRQFYIETQFGRTFVIESGDTNTPPVILLHGSGSNSAMWMADVKRLSELYHVFAIDIPGECGLSDENRYDFKGTSYSNWLLEILKHLKIEKTSIIGCSLGGWIALDFAISHPQRAEKLVLIATAGITNIKTSLIIWILITSLTGSWGFRKLNRLVYRNLEIDKHAFEFASLVKKYFRPRTEILPVFSDEQLQKITAHVLFIGGEHDCFYHSAKTAARLTETIKHSQTNVLQNIGHVVTGQVDKIMQFLALFS